IVDLDAVKETWLEETGANFVKENAEHYGIYRDLFDNAIFHCVTPLDIYYDFSKKEVMPVFQGNYILPQDAATVPHVNFKSEPDSLWTLLMTAPDKETYQEVMLLKGKNSVIIYNLSQQTGQAIIDMFSFYSNKKRRLILEINTDVTKGEELCNYIQPFPANGTGYHRYVFILFKQEKKIDFTVTCIPCFTSLEDRTFSTLEFYRNLQDEMTPAGLSFYQSEYDDSVKNVFWNILGMKEPTFEFMHPPPYHPKQKKYPHKQSFDRYLDRYRDIKDIREEVLVEKLKNTSPFKEREPNIKYPLLNRNPNNPSWLKLKERHKLLREMQWKDLD
ncbi:hypothetical protein KUTeg_019630, partial [Tegillarca granosa]